jgi:uncharacterized protein
VARRTDIFDLGRLALVPGDGRRLDLAVLPGPLTFGGERYAPATEQVPVRLDVSRTATGYALRLRFAIGVVGPCVRCLEEAARTVEVDAREVDQPASGDEELRSPYVDGEELHLAGWAHDALSLAMPARFLCRADCAGLCPVCGVSLNEVDPGEHRHESAPDPRWEKLRELKLD